MFQCIFKDSFPVVLGSWNGVLRIFLGVSKVDVVGCMAVIAATRAKQVFFKHIFSSSLFAIVSPY